MRTREREICQQYQWIKHQPVVCLAPRPGPMGLLFVMVYQLGMTKSTRCFLVVIVAHCLSILCLMFVASMVVVAMAQILARRCSCLLACWRAHSFLVVAPCRVQVRRMAAAAASTSSAYANWPAMSGDIRRGGEEKDRNSTDSAGTS